MLHVSIKFAGNCYASKAEAVLHLKLACKFLKTLMKYYETLVGPFSLPKERLELVHLQIPSQLLLRSSCLSPNFILFEERTTSLPENFDQAAGWLQAGQMGCGKSTFIKCVSAALKDLTLEDFTPDPEVRYMALRARGDLQGAGCKHHFMIEVSPKV